jgi:hypothetical protein
MTNRSTRARPIDPRARKLAELVLLCEFIINPYSSIILAISALVASLQLSPIPICSSYRRLAEWNSWLQQSRVSFLLRFSE